MNLKLNTILKEHLMKSRETDLKEAPMDEYGEDESSDHELDEDFDLDARGALLKSTKISERKPEKNLKFE